MIRYMERLVNHVEMNLLSYLSHSKVSSLIRYKAEWNVLIDVYCLDDTTHTNR